VDVTKNHRGLWSLPKLASESVLHACQARIWDDGRLVSVEGSETQVFGNSK
jgi:hypothetical protein